MTAHALKQRETGAKFDADYRPGNDGLLTSLKGEIEQNQLVSSSLDRRR